MGVKIQNVISQGTNARGQLPEQAICAFMLSGQAEQQQLHR